MTNSLIPLIDIDWTLLKGNNKTHDGAHDYAFATTFNMPTAHKHDINPNGMTDQQIIYEVLKLYDVPTATIDEKMPAALSAMTEYFHTHENEAEYVPMPGVVELLQKLAELEIPLGLLTGNLDTVAWRKLELAGIKQFFTFGAFGNMAAKRAELVPLAIADAERFYQTKFDKSQFLIVGDAPLDVKCAKDNAIPSIAVAAGVFTYEQLLETKPELTLHSLNESTPFIQFLTNSSQ